MDDAEKIRTFLFLNVERNTLCMDDFLSQIDLYKIKSFGTKLRGLERFCVHRRTVILLLLSAFFVTKAKWNAKTLELFRSKKL
jgi:hypothetical protein